MLAIAHGREKNKATGYGSRCHHNLYYDGILCCPIEKHHGKKKPIQIGRAHV